MGKEFDGRDYTKEAVLEELSLIERHARDGSALTAGCSCIEEKHLLTLAGLASEMPTLTSDSAEAQYYIDLAEKARQMRKEIIEGDWKGNSGKKCSVCIEKHGAEHCLEECKHG